MTLTLWDHGFAVLIIAFQIWAAVKGKRSLDGMTFDTAAKINLYWSNGVVLWIGAGLVIGMWILLGRELRALGLVLEQDQLGVTLAIAAGFVVVFSVDVWYSTSNPERRSRLTAKWRRDVPFLPTTPREVRHFALLGTTAGITEEILARGFLLLYLIAVIDQPNVGAAASVIAGGLLFAFAHRYEGNRAMSRIFVLAVFFGAITVVSGSIVIPMVLHAAVNIVAGVLSLHLVSTDSDTP